MVESQVVLASRLPLTLNLEEDSRQTRGAAGEAGSHWPMMPHPPLTRDLGL
jgi:hypothetical protein